MQGCTDGARTYRMPFISGKDSLFNEFDGEATGTLLISALGLVPDLRRAVDSAGMQIGDDLWLVGANEGALGGSLASIFSISALLGCPPRLMTHCRVTGRSTLRSARQGHRSPRLQ